MGHPAAGEYIIDVVRVVVPLGKHSGAKDSVPEGPHVTSLVRSR